MLVANLASIPMQDSAIPLLSGLVPILTVLGMELILSFGILKSMVLRKLFCGKPVILIDNGRIAMENLRSARVTLDELTGHLRQKDVLDIRQVQYAILETDGNLSVFPFSREEAQTQLPITLVADGRVQRENLTLAGKTERWLREQLRQKGLRIQDTLLATVDSSGALALIRKEDTA